MESHLYPASSLLRPIESIYLQRMRSTGDIQFLVCRSRIIPEPPFPSQGIAGSGNEIGSDHCTIVWSSKVQLQPQKVSKRINVRPLKSSSLLAFKQFIQEHNWSDVLSSTNVNYKVNSFLEEVSDMVDIFFPLKSIKVHEDDKPYINGRIKHLIRKRDKAYHWKS